MIRGLTSIAISVICLGMLAGVPANAQSTTPTLQDEVSQHHQLQYRMMNEMTQQMTRMTEQMSRGDLSPQKMSEQISRMAKMMQFMSGLVARPAHTHAQLQKEMDQMRAQMNEMMTNGAKAR